MSTSAWTHIKWFREHSELMGSRGSARRREEPEPEGADFDFCYFTDDIDTKDLVLVVMKDIVAGNSDFRWIDRRNGYATIASSDVDLSVLPWVKREELLIYDELRFRGVDKKTAVNILNIMKDHRKGEE